MKVNFFNIVIPTRNRLITLRHSLQTALNQDYSNYKIIISDNNSNDGTQGYVENLKTDKIEYFNTGRSLSMSSNYEFALSKIEEGFVILIGDDDGLLHSALTLINDVINKEKVLAISSNTAFYYWHGASPYEDLLMIPKEGRGVERRVSVKILKQVIEGSLDYPELPMLYTGGVVHSSLIEQAKNSGGKFYHSFTPDVYSGIAIASVVDEYVKIEQVFAISGLSKFSNGQSQLGSNKDTSIAKAFFNENDIPFHSELGDGKIKSIHFLTLESYLQSCFLRINGHVDMEHQFSIVVAKSSRKLRKEIRDYLRLNCDFDPISLSKEQCVIYLMIIKFSLMKIIRRLSMFINWDYLYVEKNIGNVYEASDFMGKKSFSLINTILCKVEHVKFMMKKF